MQDELANHIIEQLRSINDNLKALVKRLDRIEKTIAKTAGEEELVILPRTLSAPPPVPPPGSPPIIESRRQ